MASDMAPDAPAERSDQGDGDDTTFVTARLVVVVSLLCAAMLIAGLFVGRATKSTPSTAGDGHSSVDVGFLRDMMIHHDQAITMSASELWRGGSNSVRQEALDILLAQRGEYVQMAERLDDWGVASAEPDGKAMGWMGMSVKATEMPGLATPAQLETLKNASGKASDELFLELMIKHHRAGAEMANAAASRAKNDWVIATAVLMARSQETEIAEMTRFGKSLGVEIPDPGVLMDPSAMPEDATDTATDPTNPTAPTGTADTTAAHDMGDMEMSHDTSG